MEYFLAFTLLTAIAGIGLLMAGMNRPMISALADTLVLAPTSALVVAVLAYAGEEWSLDMASTYAFLQSLILCGVCLHYLANTSKGDSK